MSQAVDVKPCLPAFAADALFPIALTLLILGLIAMSVMSQNLIPVHIAFIPLIVPPLLKVMNKLRLDRRLITTCLTFGLITTYMFIPVGFGSIYLNDILLFNIQQAGLDTSDINIMQVMGVPALGMLAGLLIAIFFSYRKPRNYKDLPIAAAEHQETPSPIRSGFPSWPSLPPLRCRLSCRRSTSNPMASWSAH